MNPSESYYRRTVSAIGFALLIWFLLIQLFSIFVSSFLPMLLEILLSDREILSTLLSQGIYAAGYLFCFMLPVLFLKKFISKAGCPYQSMYSPAQITPWLPLITFSCIAIVLSAAHINSSLMDIIGYHPEAVSFTSQESSSDPKVYELILDFIVICLVPGFCEELLFRGAILSNCLPFGKSKAIFISALLFSLMHQNAEQIFYTFVMGLLLGFVYVQTKSIWNCVILHTLNNFFSYAENIVLIRVKDQLLATTYVSLIELFVFLLGILSTVILILRFFSQKDAQFRDGFFGKTLDPCAEYAPSPINRKRATKLFMAPSMILFLALCVLQIVSLMIIVIFGGSWFGSLG